jgi:hypothetical protein
MEYRKELISSELSLKEAKQKIEKIFSDYKVFNFTLITDGRSIDHLISATGWGIDISGKNLACFDIDLEDDDVVICNKASSEIKKIFDGWFEERNLKGTPIPERPYDIEKWRSLNTPFFRYNRGTRGIYCTQTSDPSIFKMLYKAFGFDKAEEAVDRIFEKYNPIQA